MAKLMRAARLHSIGEPFQVDTIPIPEVRPTDVLVEVKAAGVVPNLRNVVTNYPKWFPFLPLPKLPAIYGSGLRRRRGAGGQPGAVRASSPAIGST